MPILDQYGRPLQSLRISVTDRCNLRCEYCMPQEEYIWLERSELLTLEEIAQLASVFASLGVTDVRLTGGEPLLRRNLEHLVEMLSAIDGLRDIALTTNGLTLAPIAETLRSAGLDRVTVSLDTLRPDRFLALTRRDAHAKVLEGIAAAQQAGFEKTKLNAVIMRGFNDDEIVDLIEFGKTRGVEIRFIEYMDVGGALRWSSQQVFPRQEILARLEQHYGKIAGLGADGSAPATGYVLSDGTRFGVIASTTQPFCGTCDRARITADGMYLLCLYAQDGIDLKKMLRSGDSPETIASRVAELWTGRRDRGAEERLGIAKRSPLYQIQELRSDPHREMHTRGG
jgi:GTP 3',8-cyclase